MNIGLGGEDEPVESLETTLPLSETVWSYFLVELLYLSVAVLVVMYFWWCLGLQKRWVDVKCMVTFAPASAAVASPICWEPGRRGGQWDEGAFKKEVRGDSHTFKRAGDNAPLSRSLWASGATRITLDSTL